MSNVREMVALTEKGLLLAVVLRMLAVHGCKCDACKIAQETVDKAMDDNEPLLVVP